MNKSRSVHQLCRTFTNSKKNSSSKYTYLWPLINSLINSFRKLFVSHKGDQPLDELKEYGSTAGVIKKLASDDNVSVDI